MANVFGRTRIFAAAATIALCHIGALAQVTVTSGFNTTSGWQPILINTPAGAANILTTGGNPGGFAELRAVLDNTTLGGAGFFASSPIFQLGTLNEVTLAADYRWIEGPAIELRPFLIQNSRLYSPNTTIPLTTNPSWSSLGQTTFPLSIFSNSTGIPLNPFTQTQVGFVALMASGTPTFLTARVGIDNITLQVIPAPEAALLLLGMAPRRRRQ